MNYITIKTGEGTRVSKIPSLDPLQGYQDISVESPFLTFKKGLNPQVQFVQVQIGVYERLREEYLKFENKNPKTMDLISRVDSALASL
ncbi:MAG: hypothetical protein Q7R52_01135 [archaeon]|nr:hypothetical protein [archaeon]